MTDKPVSLEAVLRETDNMKNYLSERNMFLAQYIIDRDQRITALLAEIEQLRAQIVPPIVETANGE